MPLEDLTPDEIRSRVINMDNREATEFLESLPQKARARYEEYWMQGTREYLSHLAESPEEAR